MKIGLAGYSRTGKDEVAKRLIEKHGYARVAIGDFIKQQLRPLVLEHLGIDALTVTGEDKERIRKLLELWGDLNFTNLLGLMRAELRDNIVNSRICRTEEAELWRSEGGIVIEIRRPYNIGKTLWERHRMNELRKDGLVDFTIINDSTVEDLHQTIDWLMAGGRKWRGEIRVKAACSAFKEYDAPPPQAPLPPTAP